MAGEAIQSMHSVPALGAKGDRNANDTAATLGSWQAGDFAIDQTGKVWIYTGSAWVSSRS